MRTTFRIFAVGLMSCTAGLCNSSAIEGNGAREHVIEITSFSFVPSEFQVSIGDTITWINRDIVPHTATGADESWDTKTLLQNESRSFVVSKTMAGEYLCRFHPNMKATIAIAGPDNQTHVFENKL